MKIFKFVTLFVLISLISFASPISVLVQPGGSGTTYDSTTPIEVQKISVGTTTVPVNDGEIVTPGLTILASGVVRTNGGNARGNGAIDLQTSRIGNEDVAGGRYTIILGGSANEINSTNTDYSNILGGANNRVGSSVGYSTIVGGANNYLTGSGGTICGGSDNTLSGGIGSFIGSGYYNQISGASQYSIIGTGYKNYITVSNSAIFSGYQCRSSSIYGNLGGGYANHIASHPYQFIGGGYQNVTEGTGTAILSGYQNSASGPWSVVAGGYNNKINSINASASAIIGGTGNTLTSAGNGGNSVILGGWNNNVNPSRSSVVAGEGVTGDIGFRTFAFGGSINNLSGNDSFVTGYSHDASNLSGVFVCGGGAKPVAHHSLTVGAYGSPNGNWGNGYAQAMILTTVGYSTDTTPLTLYPGAHTYLPGSIAQIRVASGSCIFGQFEVVGMASDTLRSTYSSLFTFRAKNLGGTITIATGTTEVFADSGMENCSVNIKPDSANNAMYIEVIGSSTTNIRWVGTARCSQIRWP